MFNNPISALIIGTAMIATALILKPCLEGRKCQCENAPREIICKHECTSNAKQYRYQFIDNDLYFKEKVFDRETGVVYGFGKNEDGARAVKQDFVKGFVISKEQGDEWLY